MSERETCNSCKRKIANMPGTVVFHCPKCKAKIIRCSHCRSIAAKYVCSCGFEGPN